MGSRSCSRRRVFARRMMCAALAACGYAQVSRAGTVTLNTNNNSTTNWSITNGNISVVFNPSADDITTVQLGSGAGASANLLGGSTPELDQEFAGTPFGSGPATYGSKVGPGNSYVDVWTSTASAQNSSGGVTNPITYAFHYLIFANDPTIYCYEVLNHSATDPATSVGQGQFLFRSNITLFPNLYQINTGPNQLGTAAAMTTIGVPSTNASFGSVSGQAGRTVSNVTYDLSGSGISGDNGTNFFTKYDYSIYSQFFQAETMYGNSYAVTEVDPATDTLTGGPTKQELAWTDPGILNMEFLSDHYGIDGSGSGTYPGYGYYPTQGVATTRLFGPYGFTISSTTGTTAAAINQNAVNAIPNDHLEFNTDTELTASGYISTTNRGVVQVGAGNSAGWSSNSSNNTVVLSEPGVNFQESTQGYQYVGQLNQSGNVTISNVVPGTYRLSLYQLGQWGETRIDGVVVNGDTITIPQNVKFTPENFGTAPPIWTIGTPNRSSNEFLNGHNATGADQRQFDGAYNYWAEESALGHNGYVSYNATATTIGGVAQAATNNPNAWIANQWVSFNPGEYDSVNGTSDFYSSPNNPNYNTSSTTNPNGAPNYVVTAGGPGSYTGAAWQVHFVTTTAQNAQGQYVVLSVALGAQDSSLVISLNGHSETWSYNNFAPDDPMIRSGDAGFYQWAAFQYPTSDLSAVGTDNVLTLGLSNHPYGVMYDALRLEITNTSASPTTTGWHDYNYITSSQTAQNDASASTASNSVSGSSTWALSTGGSWAVGGNWTNYIIPAYAGDTATFLNTSSNATVTLDGNHTIGVLELANGTASYNIAQGSGGSLTLSVTSGTAQVQVTGSDTISAPVILASNTQITTSTSGTLNVSGVVSGAGGLTTMGTGAVVLSALNSYTGGTYVASGSLTIAYNASIAGTSITTSAGAVLTIDGSIPANANISGGSTLFGAGTAGGILTRTIGSLNLTTGSLVTIAAPSSSGNRTVLVTGALSFAGTANAWQGSLNLSGNDMIVRGGSLMNITNQIEAGYAGGGWNGATGIVSSAAAGDATQLTAIGSIQSLGNTFDGVSTTIADVLVKYTYYGDANLDGIVDGSDYSLIDYGYLQNLTGWYNGDFNYDRIVDGSDYTLIDNTFNQQGAMLTAQFDNPVAGVTSDVADASTAVPEPAGAALLVMGLFPLLGCRRFARYIMTTTARPELVV